MSNHMPNTPLPPNPWTLLDTQDLHGTPRTTRERTLDDVIEHLQTLATLPEVRRLCKDDVDDIFQDLVGGGDLTEAITVVMRLRRQRYM